ncbi:MAG: DUF3800 domain-containing protein [Chloroflexi bacterium]|nr:DUF3800 domain-containing protein [Chloroflexota bacterium]
MNWFFVDESGDPTFYDRNGNLIVGQEGCSPILILGFIETANPAAIRSALRDLHTSIGADDYLKDIPSIQKTHVAFHAKDDVPEVRQAVFKRIRELEFEAQFVVARKIERVFRNSFIASESKFYDHLIGRLFENALHRYTQNRIYFAQRGTRKRQAQLEQAIHQGLRGFAATESVRIETNFRVAPQTAVGEPCLQVIDYMNWAVYRAFVKREMRYYQFVQDKVNLLVDLYDQANYPRNQYNRANPFHIEKASPL